MIIRLLTLLGLAGFWNLAYTNDLIIDNVEVIKVGSNSQSRQWVHIHDDRIAKISNKPIQVSSAIHIDGTDKFLSPGLTDSHVHVSSIAGMEIGDLGHPELIEDYRIQQPRSYLYFGVTQVIDLNGTPDGFAAFTAQPLHPDFYRCGGAPALNGYPTVFVPAPVRYVRMPDYIVEPANTDGLPSGENAAEHTPEAVVARIADSGAICIKLFIEDGFGAANDWPILSVNTMKRVVELAHKRGLIVVAHANAIDMQQQAVEAQVDVLAHGLWNWINVEDDGGIPEPIATHLKKIQDGNIGWQATLRVMEGQRALFLDDTLEDPIYPKVVPASLLDWYRTEEAQTFKNALRKDFGEIPVAMIARIQKNMGQRDLRTTKYLSELGHPLLLGSDTPSAPTYGNQPGYDTYREILMLAEADISPEKIFLAGTINNAKQFGLDSDYGVVEQGKMANLLLLNSNPLKSVEAWNQIDKIILRGQVIERKSLAADSGH